MKALLRKWIARFLGPPEVDIIWHENRRSYLSFRKTSTKITLRLHELFRGAPAPVHEALMRYVLQGDPAARKIIRHTAHEYFLHHRTPSDALEAQGRTYGLRTFYQEHKAQFFTPAYEAAIGWGSPPRFTCFRHITFGTYDRYRNQIRIHPLLDHPEVPSYFVSFIVYHEMLHAVCLPHLDRRGHHRVHTKEFRERERLFPHYAAAKEWEKQSLLFFRRNRHRIMNPSN